MPFEKVKKVWMNGRLVDPADAKIHVHTHAVHYGSGLFEGIRCYNTKRGPAIFRLEEHTAVCSTAARSIDGTSVHA
jgi:branched-chain amino acid aminotransferase